MYCNVLPLLLAPMIQLLHRCLVFCHNFPSVNSWEVFLQLSSPRGLNKWIDMGIEVQKPRNLGDFNHES